ncbi:hypothetical protein S40285_10799, partial [Stachybotrys chlorohalonatus IBT 40285]
MVWD